MTIPSGKEILVGVTVLLLIVGLFVVGFRAWEGPTDVEGDPEVTTMTLDSPTVP
jgi:hypothetical protein